MKSPAIRGLGEVVLRVKDMRRMTDFYALCLVLIGVLACPLAARAGATFTLGRRPIAPTETNFAGHRQTSPTYRVVIQINHDTRGDVTLDLALVDDVYRVVRGQQKHDPLFARDALPLVFITEAKMQRFMEAPQRLLFGRMDFDVKKQADVYPSPNAVFISDATLADPLRLRRALEHGLGYFFNTEFHRAVGGLDQARPRPAD